MQILKLVDTEGNPLGVISWFAVHCTSMNNTNRLISGDNKGYASYLFEQYMNPNSLPGKVSNDRYNIPEDRYTIPEDRYTIPEDRYKIDIPFLKIDIR